MNKRSFSFIGKIRTLLRLSFKELAAQANITPEYLSMLEKKRNEPGVSVALRLALSVGLRVDDLLNLYSGKERLVEEFRPLFRLPHTIRDQEIVKLVAGFNQPGALEEQHYSNAIGAADYRVDLFFELSRRIAELEKATPEYLVHQRAEFIPLSQRSFQPDIPEKMELGAAYSALLEQQKITAYAVAKKTGLSRFFLSDLNQSRAEVSVINLDLASWAVGVTVDELIFIAYPQLAKLKWPFFIQASLEAYHNQEMVRLLTSPATLAAFEQAEVHERVKMMLGYKSWWLAEAQLRQDRTKATTPALFTPPVFKILGLKGGLSQP